VKKYMPGHKQNKSKRKQREHWNKLHPEGRHAFARAKTAQRITRRKKRIYMKYDKEKRS